MPCHLRVALQRPGCSLARGATPGHAPPLPHLVGDLPATVNLGADLVHVGSLVLQRLEQSWHRLHEDGPGPPPVSLWSRGLSSNPLCLEEKRPGARAPVTASATRSETKEQLGRKADDEQMGRGIMCIAWRGP